MTDVDPHAWLADAVARLLDEMASALASGPRRNLITHVADRPGHDHRYAIEATKLETELGWRASENFESGLRKTIRWYLDRADWWQPLLASYTGDRLGLKASVRQLENLAKLSSLV